MVYNLFELDVLLAFLAYRDLYGASKRKEVTSLS
jgi:uncharacterized membrane protein